MESNLNNYNDIRKIESTKWLFKYYKHDYFMDE